MSDLLSRPRTNSQAHPNLALSFLTENDDCYFYPTTTFGVDDFIVFVGLPSNPSQATDILTRGSGVAAVRTGILEPAPNPWL